MIELVVSIMAGVLLGIACGFLPGFSSNNLNMLLLSFGAFGLATSNYQLAAMVVAVEISSSFFEFLSPMLFGIGNEETSLALGVDPVAAGSLARGMRCVVLGGLVGVAIALPLAAVAGTMYPLVYSSIKPLAGWILAAVCVYMVVTERGWKSMAAAAAVFVVAGCLGIAVGNGPLLPAEYQLLPVFIGMYGVSSIISGWNGGHERKESFVRELPLAEKVRIAFIAFVSAGFASLVTGVKKGQASAIAMRAGSLYSREKVLFALPAVALAFNTMSVLVLGSAGKIRSSLSADVYDAMGAIGADQALLFAGVVALSACAASVLMTIMAKPLGRLVARTGNGAHGKGMMAVGMTVALALVFAFTGLAGMLVAATAACVGLLSKRLHVRSVHMMGVLLLPSILRAVM
ncbi:MAG: tripartite tricarboxylate transporter permease [Candidatus Aenigmarchaeota archaeon]|nr:tripartite tricarboxylate transporter permease [Candidatus Aenigmarchaeota archaeon]